MLSLGIWEQRREIQVSMIVSRDAAELRAFRRETRPAAPALLFNRIRWIGGSAPAPDGKS
tara:strand:- start:9837 stop:10016 length:180 start_codon:yes stop_codon:yes gene_type:complete